MVKTIQQERSDENYNLECLFKDFHIRKLNLNTIGSWLEVLGFNYELCKKSYYVDNHELPETIKYRNEFIDRYFEYEFRCYRWISITEKERDEMLLKGEVSEELGYRYFSSLRNSYLYEFHVDDHQLLQRKFSHLPYGGYVC